MDTIDYEYLNRYRFEVEGLNEPADLKVDLLNNPQLLKLQKKIVFRNCVFNDISLLNIQTDYCNVYFENCEIQGSIDLRSCSFGNVVLEKCELFDIQFLICKISSINIGDSLIEGRLSVSLCEVVSLNIDSKSQIESCLFDSEKLDYLYVNAENEIEEVVIRGFNRAYFYCNINRVRIVNGSFHLIHFSSISTALGRFDISEFDCQSMEKGCNMTFQGLRIGSFSVTDADITGGSIVFSETVIRDLEIYDSILPGLSCNRLTLVNTPQIIRSDITDVKMNNVVWPNNYQLKASQKLLKVPIFYLLQRKLLSIDFTYSFEEINELAYLKDSYRQLKLASQKNGNDLMAMQFYANEMRMFWKEIRISGGVSWQDRILIFLQRWSSNFGQSWALPLLWLFFFHGLFFSCVMSWYWNNNFSAECEFGQFWVMLNPVHNKPDFVNTGAGTFTDFIMRLFDAYFIYHFLKVTRKFAKG